MSTSLVACVVLPRVFFSRFMRIIQQKTQVNGAQLLDLIAGDCILSKFHKEIYSQHKFVMEKSRKQKKNFFITTSAARHVWETP